MRIRVWAEHTANPGRRCRNPAAPPSDVVVFEGTRAELAVTSRQLAGKKREFHQAAAFSIREELGLAFDSMREYYQEPGAFTIKGAKE